MLRSVQFSKLELQKEVMKQAERSKMYRYKIQIRILFLQSIHIIHSLHTTRSKRIKNSKNLMKKHMNKDITDLIIGGQDTCQGDSGGPMWVEEDGVGRFIRFLRQ